MLHLFTLPTTLTTGLIPQTRKTKSVCMFSDKSVHLRPSVPKHLVRACTKSILVKKTCPQIQSTSDTERTFYLNSNNLHWIRHTKDLLCPKFHLYIRSDRSLSSMTVDQCNTGHFKSSAPHKYSRNTQSHKYGRNTMSRLTSDCNALGKWPQIFFVHKITLATTLHQRPRLLTDFDTEYPPFLCVFLIWNH